MTAIAVTAALGSELRVTESTLFWFAAMSIAVQNAQREEAA